MRKLWLLFLVGLATGFFSKKLLVSSQSSVSTDDMYLEGRPSGDVPLDDEDNQDGSGSGSGDYGADMINWFNKGSETKSFLNEPVLTRPLSTAESFHSTPTNAAESQDQTTTVNPPPYIHSDSNNGKQKVTNPTVTKMPSPNVHDTTKASTDNDNSLDSSGGLTKNNRDEVLTQENENEILVKYENRGRNFYEAEKPEQVSTENMWERTEVLAAVIACGVVGFVCAVSLLLLLAYRMKKKDEGSYELGDTKLSSTAYHKAPSKEFYA